MPEFGCVANEKQTFALALCRSTSNGYEFWCLETKVVTGFLVQTVTFVTFFCFYLESFDSEKVVLCLAVISE